MYINPINRWENEPEIISFIQQNAFATLVTQGDQHPVATHLPVLLDQRRAGEPRLSGHVARANPQWKTLAGQKEVLVIFQGPHAYISSSWYNHENVPTWNFLAVHVYGKIRIIEGEEALTHLKHLVDIYEADRPNRVRVETMNESYVASQVRALVAFEIEITEVQASAKLSQNRDKINHDRIVAELSKSDSELDRKVAAEMVKHPTKNG